MPLSNKTICLLIYTSVQVITSACVQSHHLKVHCLSWCLDAKVLVSHLHTENVWPPVVGKREGWREGGEGGRRGRRGRRGEGGEGGKGGEGGEEREEREGREFLAQETNYTVLYV